MHVLHLLRCFEMAAWFAIVKRVQESNTRKCWMAGVAALRSSSSSCRHASSYASRRGGPTICSSWLRLDPKASLVLRTFGAVFVVEIGARTLKWDHNDGKSNLATEAAKREYESVPPSYHFSLSEELCSCLQCPNEPNRFINTTRLVVYCHACMKVPIQLNQYIYI